MKGDVGRLDKRAKENFDNEFDRIFGHEKPRRQGGGKKTFVMEDGFLKEIKKYFPERGVPWKTTSTKANER